ncbi:MAG: hypothetical protein Q7N87_02845 [Candidatus Uhrbacteria bacterium]|nr:hypothetical protein [Candidatus Uhrbacteria bacterium]
MNHFLIFGTHPLLSLAEAKAVIGGQKPEIAGEMAMFDVDQWDGGALNDRLGGTIKLGEVIAKIPLKELTAERLADEIEARPRGKNKIEFGLTIYGGSSAARQKTKNLAIGLKRVLQERGQSVRWVTGEKGDLTPAAVAKAHLIDEGYDFCVALTDQQAIIGLTTNVQSADAWSLRDYGRPFRDLKTGMLPPKLARMMVNLGVESRIKNQELSILDPFCGGGTVLMEAALMGYQSLVGSDMDARQVEGCNKNLDWLVSKKLLTQECRTTIKTFVSRAENLDSHVVDLSSSRRRGSMSGGMDSCLRRNDNVTIVTEGYLGKPLIGHESIEFLKKQKREIEELWGKAFEVFSHLQTKGGRIVCVWPIFVSGRDTLAVDAKEQAQKFGYTVIDPLAGWHEKAVTLTYARPDQHVKRNIVVLEKI